MVSTVQSKSPSRQEAPRRQEAQPAATEAQDRQLLRWGAIAGLAGVAAFIGTVAVVVGLGLPAADDPETLTDFADIEGGRIAEHFLYLGALILFALHLLVLYRLLRPAHAAAALFGTAVAEIGLVIMAASSVLHVSTAPLADLYTAPDASAEDQAAIEYAWHGAQSIFDTMLATGVLLVPIGILLLGFAMRNADGFGDRLGFGAIALGVAGLVGAAWEIIDTASDVSAAAVLAIVVFHLTTGWRTLRLADEPHVDLTAVEPSS